MRTSRAARFALSIAISAVALCTGAHAALAGDMDPATDRLVLQPPGLPAGSTCQSAAADPEGTLAATGQSPNNFPCRPDNVAFANLVSELGFALAPNAFHPARTTGFGGFALTMEASFTKINSDAFSKGTDGSSVQYWHLGTRGRKDTNTNSYTGINNTPDSVLQLYSLKARKGLPLGFELTGVLGYLANTTIWTVGGDVRWAPFEGFRTGAGGILPDIGVGGGVRTAVGTDKFTLTTVGLDFQISKRIPIADSFQLTPYVGFQRIWVFGDSAIVDSTPNVDPLAQCGYQGPDPSTGSPVCANKLSNGNDNNSDFNNNFIFQKVRTQRNRGIVGLTYRYEMLYLAGQFLIDLTDPTIEGQTYLQNERQWTLSFEAGAYF